MSSKKQYITEIVKTINHYDCIEKTMKIYISDKDISIGDVQAVLKSLRKQAKILNSEIKIMLRVMTPLGIVTLKHFNSCLRLPNKEYKYDYKAVNDCLYDTYEYIEITVLK
jgi:hypothetical protein